MREKPAVRGLFIRNHVLYLTAFGKGFDLLFVRRMMTCSRVTTVALVSCLFVVASASAREHTIVPGDTIAEIAHHYGVTQKALMTLNNIETPGRLHVGDVLMIPEHLMGNARRRHVVRNGDTISSIARR